MGIGERSRIIEDHNMDIMRKKIRKTKKTEIDKEMKISDLKEVTDKLELVIPEKGE